MNSQAFSKVITKAMELLQAALFLVLIFLPLADSALRLDRARTLNENRMPAKFPEFALGLSGLRAFMGSLDAYYADHFGFRKTLLNWGSKWKDALFRESTVSDVMFGRDGWLFLSIRHMVDDWRGARPLTPQELREWQTLLEKRRDWLAQRGIKYLFVVPPNKQSVYPEFLPEWMIRVGPATRLDQFMAHLKAHSTVEVLDLRPALLEGKQTARTYLYTDAHWNRYGGFVGYRAIIQALRRQLPALAEPLSLSAFETRFSQTKGGDLAKMLGQEQSRPEKDYVELIPRPPLQELEVRADTNILNKKWPIGQQPLYSENPSQSCTALFFRDSFSGFLTPYLAYNFKRAVYIWQNPWDTKVIEREHPDVVVDVMLEQAFNEQNPSTLIQEDGLP